MTVSVGVIPRNFSHNFHCYVDRNKYCNKEKYPQFYHPEFYFYSKEYDIGGDNGWTLDLLNGITEDGKLDESMEVSVAKIVVEEMKKDIIAHPEVEYFTFEQEDGEFYYTYENQPQKQRILDKYTRSGILIRFCNVLADVLQSWANKELNGRKINISTFAYGYTMYPPLKKEKGELVPIDETVIPRDNVVIKIALTGNKYYSLLDPKQDQKVLESLNYWKIIAKKLMFWSYEANYFDYLWYLPFLNRIGKDIACFKELGVEYIMVEGIWESANNWCDMIKSFMYSKLFWNIHLDVESLLDEYLNAYYGQYAKYIKRFMYFMETWFQEKEKANPVVVTPCGDVRD